MLFRCDTAIVDHRGLSPPHVFYGPAVLETWMSQATYRTM